eukprot:15367200-Ditylum_brightwellii.AAC.1
MPRQQRPNKNINVRYEDNNNVNKLQEEDKKISVVPMLHTLLEMEHKIRGGHPTDWGGKR